jgi:membrane associated rhomboid family serine protease
MMFGGMIWGVLPTRVGISWEGHLFGVIGGIIGAWLFSKLGGKPRVVKVIRSTSG